jgi:aerobic-type carbon monoxide dehydrogenase small subunit (CoxS/CutS family)
MPVVRELHVNGSKHAVNTDPDRSLLQVLREELDLTGSKYGCGEGRCGYCTPGMIMSGVALIESNPNPTDDDIVRFMNGNICRCGTYGRIVAAIREASQAMKAVHRE